MTNGVKANALLDISGTHLQNYVEATYDKIVSVFGEPNTKGDRYKTDAEWILETPHGVATLYNYKNGKNYLGDEGLRVQDITEWNIGGFSKESAQCVIKALTKAIRKPQKDDIRNIEVSPLFEVGKRYNIDRNSLNYHKEDKHGTMSPDQNHCYVSWETYVEHEDGNFWLNEAEMFPTLEKAQKHAELLSRRKQPIN